MRTNLDHDVFMKKGKSIALAQQVEDFLKTQGKSEPTQILFGKSLYHEHCKKTGKDPYAFSLRVSMTQSVEKAKSENIQKPKNFKHFQQEPSYTPDFSPNRKSINRNARNDAFMKGETKFEGKCAKHGDQIFNIRKAGKDHMCSVCQSEICKAYRAKQKKLIKESI